MSNPIYNMYGAGKQLGNLTGLVQQFNQFRRAFQGDPRQQVQELLNSGRVSQAQYDQAVKTAAELRKILGM